MGLFDKIFKSNNKESKAVETKPEIKSNDQILDESVDELLRLYENNPDGFLSTSESSQPVKDIGKKLYDAGGMDLMLRAHEIFSVRVKGIGLDRNLEMMWNGIGDWRG